MNCWLESSVVELIDHRCELLGDRNSDFEEGESEVNRNEKKYNEGVGNSILKGVS